MKSQSIKIYQKLYKNKRFKKKVNFDLIRIKLALSKLGNPEKNLRNVCQIIGSDGKYSLLHSLKCFIQADNKTASAFISPSLKDIRERFWLGKNYLSYNKIIKSINKINKLKISLTIFEVITLIFILNASKKNNNYNLIEAGALFAKDSTNIFEEPMIQAIVNINKQHLNFLKRKTIDEIIKQKVGYLNQNTNIYIGKQKPEILRKIKKILKKNNSKITYPNSWKIIKLNGEYYYEDKDIKIKIKNKFIHSDGLYQNLGMAIKIALDMKIPVKKIKKTIPQIKFKGRLEYIKKGKVLKNLYKNELLLLDGCHSETSAKNLAKYLKTIKLPKYGIMSISKNKENYLILKQFKKTFKNLYFVPIENQKNFVHPKKMLDISKKFLKGVYIADNIFDAIKKISSREKKLICVFGSLYLIGNFFEIN